jgi:hypothetical protein
MKAVQLRYLSDKDGKRVYTKDQGQSLGVRLHNQRLRECPKPPTGHRPGALGFQLLEHRAKQHEPPVLGLGVLVKFAEVLLGRLLRWSCLAVLEGYIYFRGMLGRSSLRNIDDFKTPMPKSKV